MKEKYCEVELEIVAFENEDIITSSSGDRNILEYDVLEDD